MTNKKVPGVYSIISLIDNKRYIGYSRNCIRRMQNHRFNLKKNIHPNQHLQSAFNKYGFDNFKYTMLEYLDNSLTNKEFEQIETKWIMFFKTLEKDYGYNKVLPGSITVENNSINNGIERGLKKEISCVVINSITKEIIQTKSYKEVHVITKCPINKISDYCSYWTNDLQKVRKSFKSWLIIKEENYNPNFDYINFTKRVLKEKRKTWKDYNYKKYIKKNLEDIIPYEKRNIKRSKVLVYDIKKKEERVYSSIQEASKYFLKAKIIKCINNEYGKYKHRGCYFKRIT